MKEVKDKISIIVPVYNVEPFLRKCVYSIINQTYKNIEIILVDDESPDNCGKICDALAKEDERIKVIHQKNQGVCAARNAALKIATGDYYGFVDPDDWIAPDMFEYLLNNLKKHDADISCCRYFRVSKGKRTYSATDGKTYIYNKKDAINELVSQFTIRAIFWNKLFKKELFNDLEFPEGTIYEGTFLVHKIFEKCDKIVYLPDAKYYYYDYEKSYVNTISLKYQSDYVLANIEQYKDLHKKYPELNDIILKKVLVQSLVLLEVCFKNKRDIVNEQERIKEIANFIKEHYKDIMKLKKYDFATKKKIDTLKKPNLGKIIFVHYLGKWAKIIKKLKKYLKKLKKKFKKTKPKTIKYGISMDSLTKEDKRIFKKLHECEIELLNEFVRICEKNKLKYYLYGGTLLGAVRHKGFIPWDDDIDIIMPREDFDKLEKCCKKDLNKKYFYQTNKTDKNFPMLLAKIRMNNTFVREEKWDNLNLHKGIYIDILPLDLFPKKHPLIERIILAKFNILNSACQSGKCLSHHFISKIIYGFYKILPNSVLQKKRERFIRNICKDNKTSLVCSFGSHYRPIKKRILKKEWFDGESEKMEFEGNKYDVPKGWKEYLIHLYGPNYMDLPPVEERINHFNFYDVEFDIKERDEKNEK